MSDPEVLIVGGGLAGLCCARRLLDAGISSRIFEAADDVGGRARTDRMEGFLLDRGFQVLLTAYPEAQQALDYVDLELATFEPGALVRFQGAFHRFVDPWRRPQHLLSTAFSPVATMRDKLRVAWLRQQVCRGSLEELFARPETTTSDALHQRGFSDRIIERFFRPFLGGVFLDRELRTSSRMFEFVFRMFATGDAALPARGMGAMARQLASRLPQEMIWTNSPVESVHGSSIRLASGEQFHARAAVIACDAPAAAKLLGGDRSTTGQGVTCVYFAADRPPIKEPILVLNGEGDGPINNLCVPSQVTPKYAPPGQSLISVTAPGVSVQDNELEGQMRVQLRDWFGAVVDPWRLLRIYRIPYALPRQAPPTPAALPAKRADGSFVCGDYLETASIQGAMLSGRHAAEQIIASKKV